MANTAILSYQNRKSHRLFCLWSQGRVMQEDARNAHITFWGFFMMICRVPFMSFSWLYFSPLLLLLLLLLLLFAPFILLLLLLLFFCSFICTKKKRNWKSFSINFIKFHFIKERFIHKRHYVCVCVEHVVIA